MSPRWLLAAPLALLSLAACGGATDTPELQRPSTSQGLGAASPDEEEEAPSSGEVSAAPSCTAGATRECAESAGYQVCEKYGSGATQWSSCISRNGGDNTPIVLSFGGERVTFEQTASATFDLAGRRASVATHWPTAVTPWLVRDLDGNGAIDDGSELFGSMTRLASGARARNGFEALAELDSDGDGFLTPADAAWSSLAVWRDKNGDRVSTPDELESLDAAGLRRISLGYRVERLCDHAGNCGVERAEIQFERGGVTRVGSAIDVHLPSR